MIYQAIASVDALLIVFHMLVLMEPLENVSQVVSHMVFMQITVQIDAWINVQPVHFYMQI